MFVGTIKRGKKIQGYLDKGLLEVHNIKNRHDKLAKEITRRGYKHRSPLFFISTTISGKINAKQNVTLLSERCDRCKKLSQLT
jgi:hypothetical protein